MTYLISFIEFLVMLGFARCLKTNSLEVIACEQYHASLKCPENEVITVLEASYGRSDATTCPHPSIKTTECRSNKSLVVVQSQCEGKQSCNIVASNSLFGDPCYNTYKYLTVNYRCQKAPQRPFGSLIVCEGKSDKLECPKNRILKITAATYGRSDRTTCLHPKILTTQCSTDKPLSIIQRQCEGQQMCTVVSSNALYGDPCLNTYKYLTVDYQCTGRGNGPK